MSNICSHNAKKCLLSYNNSSTDSTTSSILNTVLLLCELYHMSADSRSVYQIPPQRIKIFSMSDEVSRDIFLLHPFWANLLDLATNKYSKVKKVISVFQTCRSLGDLESQRKYGTIQRILYLNMFKKKKKLSSFAIELCRGAVSKTTLSTLK